MTGELTDAAAAMVELLSSVREPDQIASLANEVRRRYGSTQIALIPQTDEVTGHVEFGALLRKDGETVFVAHRHPSTSPFLLRQAHRWRDSDLLSVDGVTMRTAEAVAVLDDVLGRASIQRRLIDLCILRRAVIERSIAVSEAEVRAAMDEIRAAQGLNSADETRAWLRQRGMSVQRLEDLARFHAQTASLRKQVSVDRVETYFAEHAGEFARAALVRVWFANLELAQRSVPQGVQTIDEFLGWASGLLARDVLGPSKVRLDMVVMNRAEMASDVAEAVFQPNPSHALGPFDTAGGPMVVWVSAIDSASELDPRTRSLVEKRLFDGWLADQRSRAVVEWNWGRVDRMESR
jgi:putative peptide maturation system protein